MSFNIPDIEPTEIRAGDTWKWNKSLADYPATTYTLKYRFRNSGGGFEIVASASGNNFAISVAAATTADYPAGTYTWASWVESGSEKYSVASGTVVVQPDYRADAAGGALDDRNHAQKVLAAIEAVIENRATLDQEAYEIDTGNGRRSLKRTPLADLIRLRQRYQAEVAQQANIDRIKNGLGIGGRIQFRT